MSPRWRRRAVLLAAALLAAGCAHGGMPASRTSAADSGDTTHAATGADRRQGSFTTEYAPSVISAPGPAPRIVGTDELARLLDSDAPAVVDVRADFNLYLKDHLPGSVYLSTETLRAEDGGIPNLLLPRASYATLFSRLGIRMDRPAVIYGSGESRNIDATYLAWILVGFGHPDVRVLDGGYLQWQLEGRPLVRKYPRYQPTDLPSGTFRPERATLEDVRAALGRPDVVLVDARPPDQYAGDAGAQLRRGHIPGAINHYWQTDLVEGEFAKTWKPAEEIREEYRRQGITPEKQVIAYCNGGLESSHVYVTLRAVLGYPRVRVYDGSWTEWSEREDLPIATGSEPGAAPPATRSR